MPVFIAASQATCSKMTVSFSSEVAPKSINRLQVQFVAFSTHQTDRRTSQFKLLNTISRYGNDLDHYFHYFSFTVGHTSFTPFSTKTGWEYLRACWLHSVNSVNLSQLSTSLWQEWDKSDMAYCEKNWKGGLNRLRINYNSQYLVWNVRTCE